MTYLGEYREAGRLKATHIEADSWRQAHNIAMMDGRAPVVVGRKTQNPN